MRYANLWRETRYDASSIRPIAAEQSLTQRRHTFVAIIQGPQKLPRDGFGVTNRCIRTVLGPLDRRDTGEVSIGELWNLIRLPYSAYPVSFRLQSLI